MFESTSRLKDKLEQARRKAVAVNQSIKVNGQGSDNAIKVSTGGNGMQSKVYAQELACVVPIIAQEVVGTLHEPPKAETI